MTFWGIVGILLGIVIGLGLAVRIICSRITQSNDIGNFKGDLWDFGARINVMDFEDDLRNHRKYEYRGREKLEMHYRLLAGQYTSEGND